MNFHSDNEIGVQGTIAALSLGSPATMTFRQKAPAKGERASPPCLAFRLYHVRLDSAFVIHPYVGQGDILIMDGLDIQTNYQV